MSSPNVLPLTILQKTSVLKLLQRNISLSVIMVLPTKIQRWQDCPGCNEYISPQGLLGALSRTRSPATHWKLNELTIQVWNNSSCRSVILVDIFNPGRGGEAGLSVAGTQTFHSWAEHLSYTVESGYQIREFDCNQGKWGEMEWDSVPWNAF